MRVIHSIEEFEELSSAEKLIVDFSASWCAPCRVLEKVLEFASEENKDVAFVKVDVDDCYQLSERYKITSVPTLIVFKRGVEAARKIGVINRAEITALVKM